ncbi:STAS domain-containing protein [Alteromonas mediterranea]|jgi:HptB-dependent secretion and biofilm anti anti-sigma factor|uniref:Anti-sigma factor antagonist n=2 Tax=Alteromonas mediterranea TaxID=314275 RepID=S5AB06_9ALTE|nr:STAS domain-containing protein [Alteromonas mediterranea]AGP77502.1 anti-sigma factor antagonist [Alteromonas mediterranea 615]AGV53659.1 anti-anti-sigma regulatory factor [Alteromonas mediterranea DE]CAH1214089.1 STAS-domain containing protein [Alteromonas mediterranea]|tara:strand:- start:7174 stop:7479 length:306 start_codon:yes stop_codon:yes gene_type:complete
MEIRSSYQNQGQTLVIDVGTKFDFSKVEDFRNAYDKLDDDVAHIAVDLSQTEYMDSSALGMLLNMQKSLANKELSYSIENARPQVAKILKISRFDKKFDIK